MANNTVKFSTFSDVQLFLDSLGLFHMDLSLERMKHALLELNLTEPNFITVQIVGTNGKGSTATFLESIAREHGVRTGLFTSPHFVSPRERILINKKYLPDDKWVHFANKVYDAAPNLTYFEFITVLAFLSFHAENIDIAIMEAGLGGRYDATTALQRDILCLTSISMDHEQVLGDTLLAIATDKAHAMERGMPVFSVAQKTEVMDFLKSFAIKRNSVLKFISDFVQGMELGLEGQHQSQNAMLAIHAWECVAEKNDMQVVNASVMNGLSKAFIAGRLQYIRCCEDELPNLLLLDGAHNVHGLQMLVEYVQTMPIKPAVIIFSCLADKDRLIMQDLLKKLHLICNSCPVLITGIHENIRTLNHEQKIDMLDGVNGEICDNLEHALLQAKNITSQYQDDSLPVLLCGSLYLLGDFFQKYQHYLFK